jgi:hypothetical protein
MPNDIKQPVAISFQDYRDEAIVDFFANESRSFQPDVSSGRLRLVGSSRLEMRPTAAFRASISLVDGVGGVSANIVSDNVSGVSANVVGGNLRGSRSASKLVTKFPRAVSFPKADAQLKSNAQLKATDSVGVISLIGEGGGDVAGSGEVSDWIEAALSKPTRSLASLSKAGKVVVGTGGKVTGSSVGSSGQVDGIRVVKGIKVSNLELPSVVTPVLQPVLPLRDRLNALKKTAARGGDTLKLATLQVSEMEREVAGVIGDSVRQDIDEGIGLRVVSGDLSEVPELRVVEVDGQVDEVEQEQAYCRDNIQSSIKFDLNLQKVVKAWSWLPERIKETIVSVVAVAEKEKE